MNERRISLQNGKYTFVYNDDPESGTYGLLCLRHGRVWRDLAGDKAMMALFDLAWARGLGCPPVLPEGVSYEESNLADEDMPDQYVPCELRNDAGPIIGVTVYACGYEDKPGSYGMFAGPWLDLRRALEVVPGDRKRPAYLFRFNEGGTEDLLYCWQTDRWVREAKK